MRLRIASCRPTAWFTCLLQGQAPGHGQQIAQGVAIDSRQAHEHDGMGPIVVRQVVTFRRLLEEPFSFLDADPDHDRCWFRRSMGCYAGHEGTPDLQDRRSVVFRGCLDVRQREPHVPDDVERVRRCSRSNSSLHPFALPKHNTPVRAVRFKVTLEPTRLLKPDDRHATLDAVLLRRMQP